MGCLGLGGFREWRRAGWMGRIGKVWLNGADGSSGCGCGHEWAWDGKSSVSIIIIVECWRLDGGGGGIEPWDRDGVNCRIKQFHASKRLD